MTSATMTERMRRAAARPVVSRYTASRDQQCSRSSCGRAIAKGDPAGFDCGAGPKPVCGPCCDELEAAAAEPVPVIPGPTDDLPAFPDREPAVAGVTPDEPVDLPATPHATAADRDAELAEIAGTETCTCTGKSPGFTNAGGPGAAEWWVCVGCR